MTTKPQTFLDLFSGVGGFRLGLEKAGHKCIGFCEIDKFARESYKSIFDTEGEKEYHDIKAVRNDEWKLLRGEVDIICGGFPCQAFSIAGKRRGFLDSTRGTLFFDIARAVKQIEPRIVFLENVKGLLSHDKGNTFRTILSTLDELGYDTEWQILNSKDYVAQNRERVFIVGHLRDQCSRKIFPITRQEKSIDQEQSKIDEQSERLTNISCKSIKPTAVGNVNPSANGMNGQVYDCQSIAPTLTTNKGEGSKIAIPVLSPDKMKVRQNGRRIKQNNEEMFTLTAQDRHGIIVAGRIDGGFRSTKTIFSTEGISPTLTTMSGGGQEPKILVKEATKKGFTSASAGDSINFAYPGSNKRRGCVGKQSANTVLTSNQQAVVTEDFQIRKLTPFECWRLQTFPDEAFLAAKFGSRAIAKNILENKLDHYNCEFEQKMSNSQLYKQAGNSVTVDVIYDIAKRL